MKRVARNLTDALNGLLSAISDTFEESRKLFTLASESSVDRICTDALNARPCVWPAIQEHLTHHRPDLLELFRRVSFEPACRNCHLGELHQRVRHAAAETGLS